MAAAIIGGINAGVNVVSGLKSSSRAKRAAKKEARMERLMTAEELRRLGKEQEAVLGSARAQISGSGFTGYGANTEEYLADLQKEQVLQQAFTAQVGASRASAIEDRGSAQSSAYKMGAYSSLLQAGGKIGEAFNWGLDE